MIIFMVVWSDQNYLELMNFFFSGFELLLLNKQGRVHSQFIYEYTVNFVASLKIILLIYCQILYMWVLKMCVL